MISLLSDASPLVADKVAREGTSTCGVADEARTGLSARNSDRNWTFQLGIRKDKRLFDINVPNLQQVVEAHLRSIYRDPSHHVKSS